jgi:Tfp pilus assembly protein PilO
MPSRKQPP